MDAPPLPLHSYLRLPRWDCGIPAGNRAAGRDTPRLRLLRDEDSLCEANSPEDFKRHVASEGIGISEEPIPRPVDDLFNLGVNQQCDGGT